MSFAHATDLPPKFYFYMKTCQNNLPSNPSPEWFNCTIGQQLKCIHLLLCQIHKQILLHTRYPNCRVCNLSYNAKSCWQNSSMKTGANITVGHQLFPEHASQMTGNTWHLPVKMAGPKGTSASFPVRVKIKFQFRLLRTLGQHYPYTCSHIWFRVHTSTASIQKTSAFYAWNGAC